MISDGNFISPVVNPRPVGRYIYESKTGIERKLQFAIFNGDLYYAAEVDGYDPLNKSQCTLKLIRKII